jgi:DNA-binding HxlR family transcriptional regulator
MATSYDQECPVARTLDIIGERWTILILRDLLKQGPRRFQDFQRSLEGVSPNTLSARLKTLEDHGIIVRKFYEEHPPRAEYLLTKKGRMLGPVLKALLGWGKKYTSWSKLGIARLKDFLYGWRKMDKMAAVLLNLDALQTGWSIVTAASRNMFDFRRADAIELTREQKSVLL